jgi:hypothetical protein
MYNIAMEIEKHRPNEDLTYKRVTEDEVIALLDKSQIEATPENVHDFLSLLYKNNFYF